MALTHRWSLVLLTLFLGLPVAKAQYIIAPETQEYDYVRMLALKNADMVQPLSFFPSVGLDYELGELGWDIWELTQKEQSRFSIISPRVGFVHNSKLNRSNNNGPLWTGKGMNLYTSFGVQGRLILGRESSISYSIQPMLYYAENQDFTIPTHNLNKSDYSYPYAWPLDWVQRFGNRSFTDFQLGQSEIKLSHKFIAVALSTQNMTWGPSYQNQILMSRNAGGFPHLRVGTKTPLKTVIGQMELQSFWGRLAESDYFDEDISNDRRYFTGLVAAYRPSFAEGLTLSLHRVLYREWQDGDLVLGDVFAAFTNFSPKRDTDIGGGIVTNDFYDQLSSVAMTWKFPEVGFETYVEFAKNDFPASFQELLRQPDRQRAYSFGFLKLFDLRSGNLFRLSIETTTLSQNQISFINNSGAGGTYYIHGIVVQGYTHNGQLVGASIGPGANSNFISLDYYATGGAIGAYFQRTRYNDDHTIRTFVGDREYIAEFDVNFGVKGVKHLDKISLTADLSFTYLNNWYFDPELSTWNFSPRLQLKYRLH